MNVEYVERVKKQIVIDVSEMDPEAQGRLRDGVERLLRTVLNPADERVIEGWTQSAFDEAMARLARDGAHVQVEAIREALRHHGYVTRDRVFRIGRYGKDRTLRGFTRPTNRIVTDLMTEGILPESAGPLLSPSFQDGMTADGFRVIPGLAEFAS